MQYIILYYAISIYLYIYVYMLQNILQIYLIPKIIRKGEAAKNYFFSRPLTFSPDFAFICLCYIMIYVLS